MVLFPNFGIRAKRLLCLEDAFFSATISTRAMGTVGGFDVVRPSCRLYNDPWSFRRKVT